MSEGASPVTRLFLVRHGRVHNPRQLAYGHLPRFRLDAEGREHAGRTAAWLAARGVTAIYTSPLLRTRQTARIIRQTVGPVPFHLSRRLRESELARFWQGLVWAEIPSHHPELFALFESTPGEITVGESLAQMASRVRSVCLHAARRYGGGNAVLVSHRDPIVALRLHLTDVSYDALNQTACVPGSVTELEHSGTSLRFVSYAEP